MRILKHPTFHQALRYIVGGGTAAIVDVGVFLILNRLNIWYVHASIISGVLGFFCAFFLHKYFAFQKYRQIVSHFFRYCMLGVFNILATNIILFLLVEWLGIPEDIAKVCANGSIVTWNFFIYKFFVYA